MSAEPLEIHIIADSTGESALRIARAAVAQFEGREFIFVRHRRMGSEDSIRTTLEHLAQRGDKPTVVLYTLVEPELAELVRGACEVLGFPHADLMTRAVRALEEATGATADAVARRPVGVEADYFARINAMEFVMRNDDGAFPGALREADIVLVGASRSGKTPLSMYLGYLGYKAANVPLVPGIPPPKELEGVDRWRIVGLTISAERLQVFRRNRVAGLGGFGSRDGYADLVRINEELDEIGRVQRQLGCPIVDTTGVAIEESASRVLDIVTQRAKRHKTTLRRPPGVAS